jgi:hypothetical protein
MKKLFISFCVLISINSYAQTRIYCKPDIYKCVSNLKVLKKWVLEDYLDTTISAKTYDEYKSVLTNTIAGLEMIIDDKNQCDTTDLYTDFKYNSK